MSTPTPETSPATPVAPVPTPPAAQPDVAPAVEPVETDWRAEAKKWEQRAKENFGAKQRLADLEEASKSELQKALDRAAAAEKARDDLQAAEKARAEQAAHTEDIKKWAAAAAKKHGVPADALRGDTEAEITAHAEAIAALLPRRGYVPGEGTRPSGDGNAELRDFTRALFAHP